MKFALIEVKPLKDEYIAKEMAGGLGKRLKLKNTFFGSILNKQLNSFFVAPPIALAQIAGVFKSLGHSAAAYYTSKCEDIPQDIEGAVVLSSMVDYRNEVHFIQELKKRSPQAKVIVIGSFASAMPEMYVNAADYVIQGDAESAIMAMVTKGYPPEKIVHSEAPDNLNELPMVDWEPFIKEGRFATRPFSKELGVSIQKSRGCSMTCNYCPYAAFYGKARQVDSDHVMKTIRHYYDHHNIRYFMFRDPNFGENRKDFQVFMKSIIDSGLKITWSCEARLDTFQDDDLRLMAKAGLRYIITGVESSNEKILKENKRVAYKKDDTYRKIRVLEEAGVIVQTNYIIGFPHEEEKSVLDTLAFSRSINSMFATFHIFTPQPGTTVFDNYKGKLLNEDWEEFSYSHLTWNHDTLSKEFLEDSLHNAYVKYYFRPNWFLKHLRQLTRIVMPRLAA